MADDVKAKLRELISTQGQGVLSDPNKFTSLMLDLCLGANEREISILTSALTRRMPQLLTNSGSKSLTEELRANLSHRLQNETGLQSEAANWAVCTWAEALGMAVGKYPDMEGAQPQRPQPEFNGDVPYRPMPGPAIHLDCTTLDFGEVVPGARPSQTFWVCNVGAGILMGNAGAREPWIEVSPQTINTPGVWQSITVIVDSSLLPGECNTGYINIESNGGPAGIEVNAIKSQKPASGAPALAIATVIVGILIIIGITVVWNSINANVPKKTTAPTATTTPAANTMAPVISMVRVNMGPSANNVTISWATDTTSSSQVQYGISGQFTKYTAIQPDPNKRDSTGVFIHEVVISDIIPNSTYFYSCISTDKNGKTSSSSLNYFQTPSSTTGVKTMQWSSPPAMSINQNYTYVAVITMNFGDMAVRLFPKDAPITVNNYIILTG